MKRRGRKARRPVAGTRIIMTPQEAAAFWQELQRAVSLVHVLLQPPTWRRRRTGEMRVTQTERRAMQAFHLVDGESYSALARQFRRDRHHMPRWIWTDDYEAFQDYYWRTDERTESELDDGSGEAAREDAPVAAA